MHLIDYLIVLLSILAAIGTGVWFAHKQKDTSQYFAGGGKIPAWAVGISIFATLISSVTFLAYPGAAYAGNWILLVQGLMVPIVLLALVGVIVPLFRKVIRLSTYEYFERRFGLFARLYSSFAFTLGHFSKAGTVFFLVSMALATFLEFQHLCYRTYPGYHHYHPDFVRRYGGYRMDGCGTGIPTDRWWYHLHPDSPVRY